MVDAELIPSDDFDRAYGEGLRLFNAGQFDDAIPAFARAAELRPDDFRPWEMTGCCHGSRSRWAECLAALERAGGMGHECHQCWYNRATALRNLLRADDALAALERSLALESNNPAAWLDRGLILGMHAGRRNDEGEFMDGRHARAIAAFDHSLALRPNDARTLYNKGYVLYKSSHSLAAIQNLGLPSGGSVQEVAGMALACVEQVLAQYPTWQPAVELREMITEWMGGGSA